MFFTGAIAYEKLQMKFSEPPSFKPAYTAICTWLKNLKNLGFQKEVAESQLRGQEKFDQMLRQEFGHHASACSKKIQS